MPNETPPQNKPPRRRSARFLKWIWLTLTTFSILLAMTLIVFWVRSYWVSDTWVYAQVIRADGNENARADMLKFSRGRVLLVVNETQRPSYPQNVYTPPFHWRNLGHQSEIAPSGTAPMTFGERFGYSLYKSPPAPSQFPSSTGQSVTKFGWIHFSHAWPILLFLVTPALYAHSHFRHRTARDRLRNGLCTQCGYDLRASPTCCPECGAVPAVAQQNASI